jgi:hypothetical protein
MWYIGDGELERKDGYIKLHTDCFLKSEVDFLCNLLTDFEAKSSIKGKDQYIIYIPRKNVKKFLNYIGDCPFKDYEHKWSEIPYKNKNIEINGINFYYDLYSDIEKDYNSDKYTIYELSKKYKIPIKCIKNYFNTHNINWKIIDNRKPIIQYDLNGNFIREWESGQQIKKELNYTPHHISACCTGKKKEYNGFIWKFKNN